MGIRMMLQRDCLLVAFGHSVKGFIGSGRA